MIRKLAIAIALAGFYDLGRTVTRIFLLMDHFLYRCSTFSEKKNLSIGCLIFFAKCTVEFRHFKLSVYLRGGLCEVISFVKKLATFGIIYATDQLLQNAIKILCLR